MQMDKHRYGAMIVLERWGILHALSPGILHWVRGRGCSIWPRSVEAAQNVLQRAIR